MFELKSKFKPSGDQPNAIKDILDNFESGGKATTLLGATGTGKTFTMANIIQKLQKPTLIISHNKTLAAQLATEFKQFFPSNAVHYFVSYFDYYQPESYLPQTGTYIEKEATINQEIEMYRLASMASLLSREDVIIVASVSSLYGLGEKTFFQENCIFLRIGEKYDFEDLKSKLLSIQYQPVSSKIEQGMFEWKGDILDIYSSVEKKLYRIHFDEDTIEFIEIKDVLTFKNIGNVDNVTIWPATQFLQNTNNFDELLDKIISEMEERVKYFKSKGKLTEAERLNKRVLYDMRMIKETGFTNGIENYSPYFENRLPGEPPNTLFDYFPDDFLMIIDESHMTVPQLQAMPKADKARKANLINYGFRLPSSIDHRPLGFEELEVLLNWKNVENFDLDTVSFDDKLYNKKVRGENQLHNISSRIKNKSKVLFASATPAKYELELADNITEQVIRPTGLLDPICYVYPKSGDYKMLNDSIDKLIKKKPHVKDFLDGYNFDTEDIKDVFEKN